MFDENSRSNSNNWVLVNAVLILLLLLLPCSSSSGLLLRDLEVDVFREGLGLLLDESLLQ